MTTASYRHRYDPNAESPWGTPTDFQRVTDGILWINSASHGGYVVSREMYDKMPDHLKACSFTNDQYFEEDLSWCAVVLAFPQHFGTGLCAAARETYERFYRRHNADLFPSS